MAAKYEELDDWVLAKDRDAWVNRWDKSLVVPAIEAAPQVNNPKFKNTLLNNIAMKMKKSRRKKI